MKPILFSTEMVRAIQDGTKTVTRRIIKPKFTNTAIVIKKGKAFETLGTPATTIEIKCLYQVGDIIYVRETWHINNITPHYPEWLYKADYDCTIKPYCNWKWKPSIHMPKEAARIFLRVTDVRIERLQDITEGQAKAEGIDTNNKTLSARCIFKYHLWNSTVKKTDLDKYGWNANPWVTVNEFEKISKEEALSDG